MITSKNPEEIRKLTKKAIAHEKKRFKESNQTKLGRKLHKELNEGLDAEKERCELSRTKHAGLPTKLTSFIKKETNETQA